MGWNIEPDIRGVRVAEMVRRCTDYYVGYKERNQKRELEVVAMAQGAGCFYVIERIADFVAGNSYLTAKVLLVERVDGEFHWRTVSELEGPNPCAMPRGMLKRLSPLETFPPDCETSHAADRRNRVEAYHSREIRAAKPGDILRFSEPLNFTLDGKTVEVRDLKVIEWGRRKRFVAIAATGEHFGARLSRNALARNYEVIPA